ncbi:MAG: ECF transporter S component [Clostridia bacterium]|nr:ECF transporter S component [Oscillospiraceae bacterium]MBQ9734035.1 ECF transporter S component [Clostridia bacterium]
MSKSKKITVTALCAALCVVLPIAFHAIPNGGSLFSPMHIPVLLCGLCCGPLWGLACGLVGPALSSAVTGMPMAAYLPPMLAELAVYGLCCGLGMKAVHTGKLYADIYISLAAAMLIGRIAAGVFMGLIFSVGEYSLAIWAASYFAGSVPGIIAHLILVPALYAALTKAGLVKRS